MEKLSRWLLLVAAVCASLCLQGCLPPDWSFCDCDFRDNFWNSILNDVHLLWDVKDGADFLRRVRDNTTFQGKYLQSPPDDLNCPEAPSVFWKAWPQYGITRGLIEGSMGDLWMPGARDRFKQVCIAGHLALLSICSQHYLVKSARALDAGDPGHMRWLEAAYAHMVAIRNLGQAHQIRNCMGQQGWSLDVGEFHKYTVKWLGPEAQGTVPQAAFFNGHVDPWNMLFTKPMGHTELSRGAMLPDRKTCAPFKDPRCWKRKSLLLLETCEYCCSPFQHKTGRGAEICWDDEWTYERCCQQDFKDLICELNRKGEEGGCVDCKKSVTYICLTPTEKRLKDAQNKYNENVDLFNKLQNQSGEVSADIASTRQDLLEKDEIYRGLHADLNKKMNIWHIAYHNASRLSSKARLQQQELTWNGSREVLDETTSALRQAESAVSNAKKVLSDARKDEEFGRQVLQKNISEFHGARRRFDTVSESLSLAKDKKALAEDAVAVAETSVSEAERTASEALEASLQANASRQKVFSHTESPLETATALRDERRALAIDLMDAKHRSDAELKAARSQLLRWPCGVPPSKPELHHYPQHAQHRVAEESWLAAGKARNRSEDDLFAAQEQEEQAKNFVLSCAGASDPALLCLMAKTPANYSKPNPVIREGLCVAKRTCLHCDLIPSGCEGCNRTDTELRSVVQSLVESLSNEALQLQSLKASKANSKDTTKTHYPEELEAKLEVYVPFHLTKALEEKRASTADSKSKLAAAQKTLHEAKTFSEKAQTQLDFIYKSQEITERQLKDSQHEISQLTLQVSLWEEYLRANTSFFQQKKRWFNDLSRRADHSVQKFEESRNRTFQLRSEHLLAMNESHMRRSRRDQEAKTLSAVKEEVAKSGNFSENLTRLVSDWLQQQETTQASQSGRWSERLLAAAKEVLVTMVGSLESFLDNYVISLSDKDAVMQLMQAVDRRKESEGQLLQAERELEDAMDKVKAMNISLTEAEAEDARAQATAMNATATAAQAEENATAALAVLNRTRDSLHAQEQRLETLKKSAQELQVKKTTLAQDLAASKSQLDEQQLSLRTSKERIEAADADVTKAVAAEKVAEAEVTNAKAAFVGSTLEDARLQCQPTKNQYEVYLQFRDVLALAKHVVVQRLLGLQLAEEFLRKQTDLLRDSQVAEEAFLDDLGDSMARLQVDADLDFSVVEERHSLASLRATQARDSFTDSQAKVRDIMSTRDEADAFAEGRADASNRAVRSLRKAQENLYTRRTELEAARNETERLAQELLASVKAESLANASLREARVWQIEFNMSLELERKEDALASANLEESKRLSIQVNASKYEARTRALLDTHKKHLALLDMQVELPQKDKELTEAKAAFQAAEKQVVDAQTKLDELVKRESETHTKIGETYEELNRLKTEHSEAEKEYQEQDPEDRKRSFTTSLQGSGA